MKRGVKLREIVEKMNLKNLTPEVDMSDIEVNIPDINRPALQLTGFFDNFDTDRVQVIGYVEHEYLKTIDEDRKTKIYDQLMSYKFPCMV